MKKHVVIEDPQLLAAHLKTVLALLDDIGFGKPSYGFFHGGDPRTFTPDGEFASPKEYARWKADCLAFSEGRGKATPPSCLPNTEPFTYTAQSDDLVTVPPGQALITHSHYGLGTNFNETDARLVADLDDLKRQCERAISSEEGTP